jgi:polysaccharide export outer membrane protein
MYNSQLSSEVKEEGRWQQKLQGVRLKKYIYILFAVLLVMPFLSYGKAMAQVNDYHLGGHDIIQLTIFAGGEKQNDIALTVSSSGMINVPLVGSIEAAGLTLHELETAVHEPLAKDYFVNPQVSITIKEYHSLRYNISGAIRSPGLYEMSSRATLLELIAKAGGVTADRGNVAYIMRDTGSEKTDQPNDQISTYEPIKVDLQALLDRGDMSRNIVLQTGDVVYIPLETSLDVAKSKIYVEGEVNNPGAYAFQPGLKALKACILAGGFTKYAAANRARIIRKQGDKQEIIKINLEDVKKGTIADLELMPGDLIHIPETWL